jgi:RNA polymerase sigma-70 factor (ECF subfamily)
MQPKDFIGNRNSTLGSLAKNLLAVTEYTAEQLLPLVQRRDERAMAILFQRYSKLVYSVAFRVLKDSAAAEDVTQEVFLKIWTDCPKFLPLRGSLEGLLSVMTRNRSISVLRRTHDSTPLDDIQIASPVDLNNEVDLGLTVDQVRTLIAKLPIEGRTALNMAFFDGLTYAEIAERTGQPLGTTKTRIRRALKSLREAIGTSTPTEPESIKAQRILQMPRPTKAL